MTDPTSTTHTQRGANAGGTARAHAVIVVHNKKVHTTTTGSVKTAGITQNVARVNAVIVAHQERGEMTADAIPTAGVGRMKNERSPRNQILNVKHWLHPTLHSQNPTPSRARERT